MSGSPGSTPSSSLGDWGPSISNQLSNISHSMNRIGNSGTDSGGGGVGGGGVVFSILFAGVMGAVYAAFIQPFLLAPGFLVLVWLEGIFGLPRWLNTAPMSWVAALLLTLVIVFGLRRYALDLTFWQRYRRLIIVLGLLFGCLIVLAGPSRAFGEWFDTAWAPGGLWATCKLGAYVFWGLAVGIFCGVGFALSLLFFQDTSLLVQLAVFVLGAPALTLLLWGASRLIHPPEKRWSLSGCFFGPNIVVTVLTFLVAFYNMSWLDKLAGGSLW